MVEIEADDATDAGIAIEAAAEDGDLERTEWVRKHSPRKEGATEETMEARVQDVAEVS